MLWSAMTGFQDEAGYLWPGGKSWKGCGEGYMETEGESSGLGP